MTTEQAEVALATLSALAGAKLSHLVEEVGVRQTTVRTTCGKDLPISPSGLRNLTWIPRLIQDPPPFPRHYTICPECYRIGITLDPGEEGLWRLDPS